jgi:hypothetical protein
MTLPMPQPSRPAAAQRCDRPAGPGKGPAVRGSATGTGPSSATTPQARLYVILAAVHAARPGQIRALHLDDVDLATDRITIGGISRPLDELTTHALLDWLAYRRERWPGTANPHLLVSGTSALGHAPVSPTWILNLRGLPGTLERLRIDRQLEEAVTAGADPLHLAAVFGFSEGTAIRWATNARQPLTSPRPLSNPAS